MVTEELKLGYVVGGSIKKELKEDTKQNPVNVIYRRKKMRKKVVNNIKSKRAKEKGIHKM